jgi:hypothetical protein
MPSSFDLSYTYCCLQLGCDFFGQQWEQYYVLPHVPTLNNKFIIIIILK